MNRPWQLGLFALAIFMVFYLLAGCVGVRNGAPMPPQPFATPDLGHQVVLVTNTLPTPPGAQIQAVTNKVFNTMAINAIQPPPAMKSFAADYLPYHGPLNLVATLEITTNFTNWSTIGTNAYPSNGGTLTANLALGTNRQRFVRFGYQVR